MILSCDPPRHALLIHFGKRQQPHPLQTLKAEYRGASVEIALNRYSAQPTLVAIHFVRHGFHLPFIGSTDLFSTKDFHIRSGHRQGRFHFNFSHEPQNCEEWQPCPGLTVLMSGSHFITELSRTFAKRPVLEGFYVDTKVLQLDVDTSEFVFAFGADNLKDVPVTLFVER
jgi:hypothetical protein